MRPWRHTEVAGERDLETAAERGTMDGGNDRFRASSRSRCDDFMQVGRFGGLPNSVMSAPAMKVRPAQASTIAFTSGSAMARFMQSRMPPRTAALSAFTGGLVTVTMPTTS